MQHIYSPDLLLIQLLLGKVNRCNQCFKKITGLIKIVTIKFSAL
ncbi:hypothetical protein L291_1761 [Acinetobacter guillouiae MSP4-18]|nr:hypothetical protein L291_1761 [Acinetobacter guillouiae MSP4-18]